MKNRDLENWNEWFSENEKRLRNKQRINLNLGLYLTSKTLYCKK